MRTINVAAAIIIDNKGRCLLVRKKDTSYFMQPGGKLEAGEHPVDALVRELEEELSFIVKTEALEPLGRFTDIAANEPEHIVCADIFLIKTRRVCFNPTAEIEEVLWLDVSQDYDVKLAPLTENHLLPLLKKLQPVLE